MPDPPDPLVPLVPLPVLPDVAPPEPDAPDVEPVDPEPLEPAPELDPPDAEDDPEPPEPEPEPEPDPLIDELPLPIWALRRTNRSLLLPLLPPEPLVLEPLVPVVVAEPDVLPDVPVDPLMSSARARHPTIVIVWPPDAWLLPLLPEL